MKSSFICNCTLSIVMLAMGFLHLHAQPAPCSGSAEGIYLHGNQVRAFINNSGTLFLDEEGAAFQVPFQFPKKATIYAQGLWLAGYGPDGNLRVAAPTYSINSEDFEYFPGPLDSPGQSTAEQCANWNRVWTVSRYQIEAHLADFGDNGIIDSPLPEILGWPGKGNPHFQEIYGFELPDTPQGLAPFFDQNGDGSYTPLAGDYPMVSQAVVIPEQITWGVFNDAAGPHAESGGEPLQVEVQLTCWAFSCRENRQLDHTIFTSYKLINRSGGTIDSLLTSFWHDFDLGCFWDDHLGTAPSSNTVFTYNHNNLDGSALTGCSEENSYGENPPVQAMTVLNHALSSSLIYFRTGGVDTSPGMMSPALPEQYFRCLNGKWRDGEPITTFSCGYNPGQDYPITTFSFSGDPNDPNAWASNNTTCLPYEQHMLPGINLGTFLPDSVQIIDLAYSFFLEPGANYLGNVTSMYDGVENLQAWYDQQFSGICTPPDCEADCVWAGDTNSDGIANHLDVLPIGIALGSQGPERTTPANWSPQPGPDWPEAQYNGANFKHIDADGDGQVRSGDLGFTLLHYERTQPGYEAEAVYPEGPELFAAPSPNVDFSNLPTGLPNFAIYIELAQVPELYGLGFTLEYDTAYFGLFHPVLPGGGFSGSELGVFEKHLSMGKIDYALTLKDTSQVLPERRLISILTNGKSTFSGPLPSNSTQLRFKNVVGIRNDGSPIPIGGTTATLTFPDIPVATKEAGAPGIALFPNPTDGALYLSTQGQTVDLIELFSPTGQLLWRRAGSIRDGEAIQLGHLPDGLYYVRLRVGQGMAVRKVVVRR